MYLTLLFLGDASIKFDWSEGQTRSCSLLQMSRSLTRHLATRLVFVCHLVSVLLLFVFIMNNIIIKLFGNFDVLIWPKSNHTHSFSSNQVEKLFKPKKPQTSSSPQKLSMDDSRTSAGKSLSERSVNTPISSQSPATYENSNVVIFEVRQSGYNSLYDKTLFLDLHE